MIGRRSSGLISAGLIFIALLLLVGTDRNTRGRLLVAGGIAALAVILVVPMLSGGGVVKLDERTVTKLDIAGGQCRGVVATVQGEECRFAARRVYRIDA